MKEDTQGLTDCSITLELSVINTESGKPCITYCKANSPLGDSERKHNLSTKNIAYHPILQAIQQLLAPQIPFQPEQKSRLSSTSSMNNQSSATHLSSTSQSDSDEAYSSNKSKEDSEKTLQYLESKVLEYSFNRSIDKTSSYLEGLYKLRQVLFPNDDAKNYLLYLVGTAYQQTGWRSDEKRALFSSYYKKINACTDKQKIRELTKQFAEIIYSDMNSSSSKAIATRLKQFCQKLNIAINTQGITINARAIDKLASDYLAKHGEKASFFHSNQPIASKLKSYAEANENASEKECIDQLTKSLSELQKQGLLSEEIVTLLNTHPKLQRKQVETHQVIGHAVIAKTPFELANEFRIAFELPTIDSYQSLFNDNKALYKVQAELEEFQYNGCL
ncbi:hypothetical protein [Fangia hongkongensis]|uniref:hypothetical protein n=1 Tax=Fangia hongkongensis TaxID=270495 RepID=UPI00146C4A23|nr:hypothetical protein [Fangia hongkongensis]MBK2125440.1 hypothetical protein [Fangia hongkongensis]